MKVDDGKWIRFINEASLTGLIPRDQEIAVAEITDCILDLLNAVERKVPRSAMGIACAALGWQVMHGRGTIIEALDGVRRVVGAPTKQEGSQ
jgi:hypothetical protein